MVKIMPYRLWGACWKRSVPETAFGANFPLLTGRAGCNVSLAVPGCDADSDVSLSAAASSLKNDRFFDFGYRHEYT